MHVNTGGTFAVYSILCRSANFGQRIGDPSDYTSAEPNKNRGTEDTQSESGLAFKLRRFIEDRESAKFFLFVTIMLGTGLVIGDGILTPAISGGQQFLHSYFKVLLQIQGAGKYLRISVVRIKLSVSLIVQCYQPWQEFRARIRLFLLVRSAISYSPSEVGFMPVNGNVLLLR